MISKSPIGLSLCSWNANGILSKLTELKVFIEQHSPDLILIQETHLRPSHNINIANYTCYRNDRPTSSDNNRAFGGTLILVKNAINHYSLPTPPLQTIEATIVILTPFDHDPISIVSVYIPPNSDEYTFTIDIENLIQTSSNCVLFGDFNATHTAWNCITNSSRGVRLLDYTNLANLYIAYPDTPTRNSELSRDNKVLLFTAVMRPILAYGCPVWGYAAKTNINILHTLQNSTYPNDHRVAAEIRERFQQLQNLGQKYAFLRPEVILSMNELNLDQALQDDNKEEFQLESVRLQAFVAAADPGCKKRTH
ncbi:probable RNA-directed DNA polymerase from transposon X-element [Trichonephila clavipes]|nr:probable RNA-directed DNA polymerase from transposon X-element [Trichonephila clavipes]